MCLCFPDAGYFKDKNLFPCFFILQVIDEKLDIAVFDLVKYFHLRDFVFDVDFGKETFFHVMKLMDEFHVLLNRKGAFVFVVILFQIDIMQRYKQVDAI